MLIFEKFYDSLVNSLNRVNMTKYITVNIKTSFAYVTSQNYVCNARN